MGELKWICSRCGSEETVALHPVKTENGSFEFVHDGNIVRTSMIVAKRDVLLYCIVCGKFRLTNEYKYADVCGKSMKEAKEGGSKLTTSNIIIGVALGIIIGSIILYMTITAIFF